jgi:hypothetical protein
MYMQPTPSWGAVVRILIAVSLVLTLVPVMVYADDIKVTPACDVREEFNDNVLFSTFDRRSDFLTTISPSLALTQASERMNASLSGGLNWLTYARTTGLDATNYQVQGQAGYRWSALTDLGVSGAYVQNSRPDTVNQLTSLSAGSGSDQQNYALRIGHKFDPLTASTFSYAFGKATYENPLQQGNEVHTTGLSVTRDLGNLLKGLISVGYNHIGYRLSRSNDYSFSTGLSWQPQEKLSLSGSVGGRLTHSLFSLANGAEGSNDNWGVIGSLTATYAGESSRTSLSFIRDFAAGSGQTGATERTQVELNLHRQLQEKLTAQFSARYTLNNASFSAQESRDVALRGNAGLSYEFNRSFSVGLNYSYYRIDYSPSSLKAEQNICMLMAQWQYPVTK